MATTQFFKKAITFQKGLKGLGYGAGIALLLSAYVTYVDPEMDTETALQATALIGGGFAFGLEVLRNIYKQLRAEQAKQKALARPVVTIWAFLLDRVLGGVPTPMILIAFAFAASGCATGMPIP